ncbi:hypothetical protein [Reyranella sp.]|uniref:hypothetical protein n=1 Tax=Reyranella sp. TaxID=1929291 RepID=UPI00272F2426|nr:hypothetical protein [Reyranella sp.]MDP2377794.1 hypothetical protein [Reyranella sp.]
MPSTRSFAEETVEISNTVGIGPYTLEGVKAASYYPFSATYATGDEPVYVVRDRNNTKSEHNRGGVYTAGSPGTLTRSVWKSTNGNAPVVWTVDDLPLTIYVPGSAELHEGVVTGWLAAARHALIRAGVVFWTTADVAVSWRRRLATSALLDVGVGTYVVAKDAYFPDGRRPWTAVGAANKVVGAADIGGCFTYSTSAAQRTVTLLAGTDARDGFKTSHLGLSSANGLLLTPAAGDGIEGGADGATYAVPGGVTIDIEWDAAGDTWRVRRDGYRALLPLGTKIKGLTLSTAGSSATFSIAPGYCADKDGTDVMRLSAVLAKTTGTWAAGTTSGGLDTGTIANDTWYHVHLIKNVVTGVVDAVISLSATTPTVPAGYTLSRRLGAIETNGSAQWVKFHQIGDRFYRLMVVGYAIAGTAAATLRTLAGIPTGIAVEPMLSLVTQAINNNTGLIQLAPAVDATLLFTAQQTYEGSAAEGSTSTTVLTGPLTNTSAQIYVAVPTTSGATMTINTFGWIDRRGQDD